MNYQSPNEPVLIVERRPEDAFLLRKALETARVSSPICVVGSGSEAIRYLRGEPPFEDRATHPLPGVIFTALHLPEQDGFAVLDCLKHQPESVCIPVIVMSWSDEKDDVQKAYALGANSYIVKPDTMADLIRVIRATVEYWRCCFTGPLHERP